MSIQEKYLDLLENAKKKFLSEKILILVGDATCENASGSLLVYEEMKKNIQELSREDILLKKVGCTGRCSLEPIVSILFPGQPLVTYKEVTKEKAKEIFTSHIQNAKIVEEYLLSSSQDKKTKDQKKLEKEPITHEFFEYYGNVPFYSSQSRIALRNAGIVDPCSIEDYIFYQGFKGLSDTLQKGREDSFKEIEYSNLRGRGGAGFPTFKKWSFVFSDLSKKYIICNADEGDPGAFMDRSMLESDPYSVIEGMIISGYIIGAKKGFFYIRAEYPLAIKRIEKAIEQCRNNNLIGKNILGSEFDFDIEIKLGAGAFVCGEETALIHSIEGKRGQPRMRPPYPAKKGLFGCPTIINNVETLANIPVVMCMGGKKFSSIGTKTSGGTKVFAVSGKVKHTGLIEVPMGTSLKEIVFDICGGNDKKIKAVQTGGPAGGCIPHDLLDTKIDYESLQEVGSIMGSGGLIVLDEEDCMVDVAKFFMSFCQDESCGKCTPCREGTVRILEILERITKGEGKIEDLEKLERLAFLMKKAALCGLGRTAPNPILSTLKYFKGEYIAHIEEKRCPSKRCMDLVKYEIDETRCIGCGACLKNCPVSCIKGEPKKVHQIDQNKCIRCGKCFEVCKFQAVKKI